MLLRLVGAMVGALGLVRRFCARAEDGHDITIDRRVVGSNVCWFGKLCDIARCVGFHQRNEADEVVWSPCLFVRDLEEERRHNLPD